MPTLKDVRQQEENRLEALEVSGMEDVALFSHSDNKNIVYWQEPIKLKHKMNQPILVTLLVAFVGASVAAGLSYLVRKNLDNKAHLRSEQRLAYIHFVYLSDMIAFQIGMTSLVKVLVPKEALLDFPKGNEFELSHVLFIKAVSEMKNVSISEKLRDLPIGGAFSLVIEQQIERLNHSQLSPEQLSKLPEKAVKDYVQFAKSLSEIKTFLIFINKVLEEDSKFIKETSWLTPKYLSDQWQSIRRFVERTHKARNILGIFAGVSHEASSSLLKEQLEAINKQIADSMRQTSSLVAAANAVARRELEKINKKSED